MFVVLAAAALLPEDEYQGRDTDKQVDEILNRRPCAEEEIHDIPVATHVVADRHEAPVEGADDDEDKRCFMQCFHEDK